MNNIVINIAAINKIVIVLAALALSIDAQAERLLLIVNAKVIRDTNVSASILCDDSPGSCVVWQTYYLYSAKVTKIVQGKIKEKKIQFVNPQHDPYIEKTIRDWMVILEPVPDTDLVSKYAGYRVADSSMKAEMYCFAETIDKVMDPPDGDSGPHGEKCYTLDQIQEELHVPSD